MKPRETMLLGNFSVDSGSDADEHKGDDASTIGQLNDYDVLKIAHQLRNLVVK